MPKALDSFMMTKFRIDAMLERLRALSDDHFETHPDEINWGDVARGAISGVLKKKLRLVVTSANIEGRGTVYRIDVPAT